MNRASGLLFSFTLMHCAIAALPAWTQSHPAVQGQTNTTRHDGQHDFDFELGSWTTHLRILSRSSSGVAKWAEYEGTSVVHSVWSGRANMVELEVDGPSGHVEALSLRLYNPVSRQWSLNAANVTGGTMSVPTVGEFANGRGEFYDYEPINGRMTLVRNIWSEITGEHCHFEQAFSEDGGKTWETNWIADDNWVHGAGASPSW